MTAYIPHSVVSGPEDAPVLLLLNSMGTSTTMWDPQMAFLTQKYRVIRMDTRGHGESATPDSAYSFDDLVGDALGTLDRHGAKTATIMGCSLGSMTALGIGLTAPDRVERIVCTAARADAPEMFRQSWDDRQAVIAEKGVAGLWAGSLGVWLTPAFQEAHPDTVEAMRTEFLKTTDAGYGNCAEALKRLDYLKDLPTLSVPTLYIAGSEDKGAPPVVMQGMADATPGSQFTVIPDAGHIINVNQPDAFSAAIADFLEIV